jgi:hypothetical protein
MSRMSPRTRVWTAMRTLGADRGEDHPPPDTTSCPAHVGDAALLVHKDIVRRLRIDGGWRTVPEFAEQSETFPVNWRSADRAADMKNTISRSSAADFIANARGHLRSNCLLNRCATG